MSADREVLATSIIKNILMWKNPYDIFDIKPEDMTIEEINKKYKKIALYIHPDKCTLPGAREAFDALNKASATLKEDKYKEARIHFAKVMKESREKMAEMWKNAGKEIVTPQDIKSFEKDVKKYTQKALIDLETKAKKAEDMKLANDRRLREERMKEDEKKRREEEVQRQWEEGREKRINSWRDFQSKTRKRKNPEDEMPNPPNNQSTTPEPSTQPTNQTTQPTPQPTNQTTPTTTQPTDSAQPPPAKVQKPEPKPVPILGTETNKKKKYVPKPFKPPKIKLS